MLAQYLVDRVRKLLAEGDLSQRKIAKRTGVSRGTIENIVSGKRLDSPPKQCGGDDDFDDPLVPPKRCPTCGGLVFPPCRLCYTRDFMRTHFDNLAHRRPAAAVPILGLELKPSHRARYEEVRRRRRTMESAAG